MIKRIRQKLPAVLILLLAVLLIPGIANAKTEKEYQGNLWNFKQTIKKSSGAFTYYAYPSKNRKEAWIYKIKIKGGKNYSKLSIPSKLGNKKVTRLGARLPKDDDDIFNIFGGAAEPFHGLDAGPKKINKIKKLKLPDTVKVIQPTAFCGMDSIKTVKIPKKVRVIEEDTFYGCDNLTTIEFPTGLQDISVYAFDKCPKLKKIKIASKNKTYQVIEQCLITKKKKELVLALAGREMFQIPEGVEVIKSHAFCNSESKTINLSASVKKIERDAFMKTYIVEKPSIENIIIDSKNSVFERDGQCIYNKTDKSLSVAIPNDKGELYISDKVECLTDAYSVLRIDESGSGLTLEKVVYPKTLKTVAGLGFHMLHADKTYFTGEKPPNMKNVKQYKNNSVLPVFTDVYVPDASSFFYKEWYETYKCDDFVDAWHTFQPEDTI